MKKIFSLILVLALVILSGFKNDSLDYEQIAFDYFVSDVLESDFKDVTSFEFKGKTEESYSTLGKYKFCLKPEEKLGSMIEEVTKGLPRKEKEIDYGSTKEITIHNFQSKANGPRLFIYPSVRVADNYYVFILFQRLNKQSVKYVFELSPEGNISRSCKIEHQK